MVFAEAYFDETKTEHARSVFAISGALFRRDAAVQQAERWKEMLAKWGLPYFHMTDCALNVGVFKHLSRAECDLAAREAISIIRDTVSAYVYVTVEIDQLAKGDDALGWLGGPYEWCAIGIPPMAARWCELNPDIESVHYFFERGADGQANAQARISDMLEVDDFKQQCKFAGLSFVKKECSPGVQAADIIVWHTGKDAKRAFDGQPRRKDFVALIDEIPAYGGHWSLAMLEPIFSEIRSRAAELGLPVEKFRQLLRSTQQR